MKHLFILLMDNGGSRLLQNYILQCKKAVGLSVGEGQQLFGPDGPDMHDSKFPGTFSRYKDILSDTKSYNWDNIVKKWNNDWGEKREGHVYVEKCPCDLFRPHKLNSLFDNSYFIVGSRHPLAILEGKIRHGVSVIEAMEHWAELAKRQMYIHQSFSRSIPIRYEDMCNNPSRVKSLITSRIPELDDLDFLTTTKVVSGIRETKYRTLKNMNQEKINKIPENKKKEAEDYLSRKHKDLMEYWLYD